MFGVYTACLRKVDTIAQNTGSVQSIVQSILLENFFKVPGALGCIKIGDDNALNADKLRDNIHNFNLKYIKENKMPEWCIFSLLRLSVIKKDFLKAKQYFNDLNFFDLSFSNKIRFLVFKIFVFLKI